MTEDQVVISLSNWLKTQGWSITKKCVGSERGNDIEAEKEGQKLIVEAKGAKGYLPHTTRNKFDSGQLKTHLGKAIVKILEQKAIFPNAEIAIAHPYDEYIMEKLSIIRPQLKSIGIKMYWVKNEKEVIVE